MLGHPFGRHRILGSVSSGGRVQETWLRSAASSTRLVAAETFLPAVFTRISIDVLRSARVLRETIQTRQSRSD